MRQPMEYRSISRWASQGGGMIFLSCSAIGLSFPVRNCRSSSLTSSGAPSRDVICANSVSVRFFRKMQYSSGWPPTSSILGISICCGSVIHRQGSSVAQNRVRVKTWPLKITFCSILIPPVTSSAASRSAPDSLRFS